MSKRILFFGNERLATGVGTTAPIFQSLIDNAYEIGALVVAQNDYVKSRRARGLEIAAVAGEHNIPVLSPADLRQAKSELISFQAEAGVLVAYGKIVPQEVINLFPRGIVNIHPSLLPKHRGTAPIESVILQGEHLTGVSLMQLNGELDAGPIYAQRSLPLLGSETKRDLTNKLGDIARDMLLDYLPKVLDGSVKPLPQDDSLATYDQRITKEDGALDYQKPAFQLEREIRAYAGWPRSRATLGPLDVVVTRAHVEKGAGQIGRLWRDGKRLGVYTAEGILEIDSLIPAGKKEMPAGAFLAGYGKRLK